MLIIEMRWYSLQATLRLKEMRNVSFSKISSAVIMNSPPKTMSFIALQVQLNYIC
jgi:hypothetical protein